MKRLLVLIGLVALIRALTRARATAVHPIAEAPTGDPRADELRACAQEAAFSRLLGGIHFRADNETGLAMGAQVAGEALARTDPGAVVAMVPPASGPLGCLWEAGRTGP